MRGLTTFSILAASVAFCAQAQAELLVSRYAVSLAGVRMGEAILHATIDAKHYKVEITADVGTLLNNTKVQGEASGSRTGQKLTPERYKLVMSDGQESSVDFAASAAAGAKTANPMRGVLDPLSALLAASIRPASESATPCDKVLTVLMSRAKIDASLHPAETARPQARELPCSFRPERKLLGEWAAASKHSVGSEFPETQQASTVAGRAGIPSNRSGHRHDRSRRDRRFLRIVTGSLLPRLKSRCSRIDH